MAFRRRRRFVFRGRRSGARRLRRRKVQRIGYRF